MDGGLFYGPGISLSRSPIPGMSYPRAHPFPSGSYEHAAPTQAAVASESRFSDISFGQKLDQVVSLIREQVQETATIKEELSALRSEMSEIRQNSKLLTESVSSSNSSTPVNVAKKIPAELSVSWQPVIL